VTTHILESLYEVLLTRKNADADKSYVASLYKGGAQKISAKVMEEAQETVDEALAGDNEKLKSESADLLFHLAVLWAHQGISPDDVFKVLESRFGTGGHAEKASRK
jgi:phosphoribosyl-ATP pyrophosphohydrolase